MGPWFPPFRKERERMGHPPYLLVTSKIRSLSHPSVQAHGYDFFWRRHDDLSVLPEFRIRGMDVGVGRNPFARLPHPSRAFCGRVGSSHDHDNHLFSPSSVLVR
jgi:hypothetical protein